MLAIYVVSAAMAGATAGVVAGLLGSVLANSTVAVLGTLLGAGAATLGIAGLTGYDRTPLQCDRETSQEWVERGPVIWPLLNGATLGFGATTRLGFWLWYLIPLGCVLLGSPIYGAVIWAAYGFTRAASAAGIWLVALRLSRSPVTLLQQRERAVFFTSGVLAIVGSATFLVIGL